MTLILNGTTGVSGVDGSAATPAFQGNDANTGISFGTDIVTINTGGVARVTTDASGNVGIGTASPATYGKLAIGLAATGSATNNVIGIYQSAAVDAAALRIAGYNYANTVQTAIDFIQNSSANFESQMTFSTNGGAGIVERMRIDSSGNVGIGINNPSQKLYVEGSIVGKANDNYFGNFPDGAYVDIGNLGTSEVYIETRSNVLANISLNFRAKGSASHVFNTNSIERMRITSDGNLLVGTASSGGEGGVSFRVAGSATPNVLWNRASSTGTSYPLEFQNGGNIVGFVSYSNAITTFTSVSDYRLKENVAPMSGALEKVAALKPCTYTWKASGEAGQGFIAHELQAVVPDCVTGIKDAVDKDGNPQYQGVDTSFLVATLVAAIQELKNEVDALKGAQNV